MLISLVWDGLNPHLQFLNRVPYCQVAVTGNAGEGEVCMKSLQTSVWNWATVRLRIQFNGCGRRMGNKKSWCCSWIIRAFKDGRRIKSQTLLFFIYLLQAATRHPNSGEKLFIVLLSAGFFCLFGFFLTGSVKPGTTHDCIPLNGQEPFGV